MGRVLIQPPHGLFRVKLLSDLHFGGQGCMIILNHTIMKMCILNHKLKVRDCSLPGVEFLEMNYFHSAVTTEYIPSGSEALLNQTI